MTKIILPPIKKVDEATLTAIKGRAPMASTALIVRTGLSILADMSPEKMTEAINTQARVEAGEISVPAAQPEPKTTSRRAGARSKKTAVGD